jgi:cytochrome o ubiquinol oxidase operon protein cyoD
VAAVLVVTLAIAQILVQTRAFLHVNARAQGGWILVAYVFTAVLLLIAIGGSLWIMYHLNSNMMPGMMSDPMSQAP